MIHVTKPKFSLGGVVGTPGAVELLSKHEMEDALRRHASGDWGVVNLEDRQANDRSLGEGSRLLSAYRAKDGTVFWVITEADRSVTTVLLPDEY